MRAQKTRRKPNAIDPIAVLTSIASDPTAPATARVAAAKALLMAGRDRADAGAGDEPTDDPIERRALEILAGRPN